MSVSKVAIVVLFSPPVVLLFSRFGPKSQSCLFDCTPSDGTVSFIAPVNSLLLVFEDRLLCMVLGLKCGLVAKKR